MRILAVGAHPDDIEFLCAGTLAIYSKKGYEIFMCHVCDGNKGSSTVSSDELAKIRREEAIKSARIIGATSIWGEMSDGEVVLDVNSRLKIIDVIRQANPDLIITHSPDDYHSDHINVSRLVFESCYLANLELWKTSYPPTDRLPYLYYMDTEAGIDFNPTEYVDISDTIDTKIKMMLENKSQIEWLRKVHDYDAIEVIELTARFRGLQAGVKYAEAFVQKKMCPQVLTKRVLP
jgi:LmbE family N-acetylglucosaminyl deacetylase